MIKKQSVLALALLLLIPLVLLLGGMLSNLINPEIAAGHPNYSRNYHQLSLLKISVFLGSAAAAGVLWILACLQVIRSKQRSPLWLLLAALGPIGFAALAMLNDPASSETDRYARFVQNMNWFARVAYELCTFVLVWVVAYQTMVLNRALIVRYQAITEGVSTAQIINIQNASSGMWAFSEGLEVIYLVVLFYLLRPLLFRMAIHVVGRTASPKAR